MSAFNGTAAGVSGGFRRNDFERVRAHYRALRDCGQGCAHDDRSITRRVIRNGSVQYVEQCHQCGEVISSPIAHARVMARTAGCEPVRFDEQYMIACRRIYGEVAQESHDSIEQAKLNEFRAWYATYLASPEWAVRRHRVLARCKGVCEGCGEGPAREVHHLTYEHVGHEFLFELVGLCRQCHTRIHEKPDASAGRTE